MSRIFLSHSSANSAEAIALSEWLKESGWDDFFLDLHPERGLKAGERWQAALKAAVDRCELVICLVSPEWVASKWCLAEFLLARSLNKRVFGVIVEPTPLSEIPSEMTVEWQLVDLTAGERDFQTTVTLPPGDKTASVAFARRGLDRLQIGLRQGGLDARYFAWPPADDPNRPPYRGLKPLEADDAGIFFGRDAPVIAALDHLRGLREAAPPRLLVILGASGAGKSSFLRAGLLPRLRRDDWHFLPLPIIRPERDAISGETGLLRALEDAFKVARIATPRADLRAAIQGGAATLKLLLQALADKATPIAPDADIKPEPPTLILPIDQGEELFLAEAQGEAPVFLALLRDLLVEDPPAVIAVFTIRSDNYERLQIAKELEGVRQGMISLPPVPRGSYAEVIKGPARRLEGTARALEIEDDLVDALLSDIEAGGAKDALPLLAFTLERLYGEYHAGGSLKLSYYNDLGRIRGSIEAAVERAFEAADKDPTIPRDRNARIDLLRRGLIPWLAGIDPDTGAPRRRVARLSEIPTEARPLIQHLVEQRLLATDVNKDTGEAIIEPAHEALLRQWGLLQGWLKEDAGLLAVLEGVKRASRDWDANNRGRSWVAHATDRLAAAERLSARPDLAANLEPTDRAYLAACGNAETKAKRGKRLVQALIYVLLVGIIVSMAVMNKREAINEQIKMFWTIRPFRIANVEPYVLKLADEQALTPDQSKSFRECAPRQQDKDYCPEMVVVPAGSFMMGSPPGEKHPTEQPQHKVTIAKAFAVSKFAVTFDEWDTCVSYGDCPSAPIATDAGWGRVRRPVINVSWDDAQRYVAWLKRMTGREYRLLSEAEYEYAARGGTQTAYPWGNDIGSNNAPCNGCGSEWDNKQTAPVGQFAANGFGLRDMVGNVIEWVEDCVHLNYNGAPQNGSAWIEGGNCNSRIVRGGSYINNSESLRSAARGSLTSDFRVNGLGFRVGRTLLTR